MRICQEHWAGLRQALEERGLSHLVARSGEEAHAALVRDLKGDANASDFDPLMAANWRIFSVFVEDAGLAALTFDGCPLCAVEQGQTGLARNWIDGCADEQLETARRLDLVPTIQ